MNIHTKPLMKYLQTQFNDTLKILYTMIKLVAFQGWKDGLNTSKSINVIYHINRIQDKNHMILSIDVEKASDKIQHSFMIQVPKIMKDHSSNSQSTPF